MTAVPITITRSQAYTRGCCGSGIANARALLRRNGRLPTDHEPVLLVDLLDVGVPLVDVLHVLRVAEGPGLQTHQLWLLDIHRMRHALAAEVLPFFERWRPGDARLQDALALGPTSHDELERMLLEGVQFSTEWTKPLRIAYWVLQDAAEAVDEKRHPPKRYRISAYYAVQAAMEASLVPSFRTGFTGSSGEPYALLPHSEDSAGCAAFYGKPYHVTWQVRVVTANRSRLRARLTGTACPVQECPAFAAIRAELRSAVSKCMAEEGQSDSSAAEIPK